MAGDNSKGIKMKKVFIRTFGCQMNEYDSQKMLDVLSKEHGDIEQVS